VLTLVCFRVSETSEQNLFEERSHAFLTRWSQELKFCRCNTQINAPLAMSGRLNETNMDCEANPDIQKVCTEVNNKDFLHCSLAKRRRRSADRHEVHHTQRSLMQSNEVIRPAYILPLVFETCL